MDAIDGIVLAAGRSRRMRRPKALLDADGASFLERAVCTLRDAGCRTVFTVIATGDDEADACAIAAGAIVVRNPDPDSQPIDSVRAGLQATADAEAVLILPVDLPLVQVDTVRQLIALARERRPQLAVPVSDGEPGHPLLMARPLFDDVLANDLPDGLHTLLADHAADVLRVAVHDPGIHADIDTPSEYERHFGRSPRAPDATPRSEEA
ncbi:MAG: nucleotidyltransferase family protein [Longimicrobiales bacterium]